MVRDRLRIQCYSINMHTRCFLPTRSAERVMKVTIGDTCVYQQASVWFLLFFSFVMVPYNQVTLLLAVYILFWITSSLLWLSSKELCFVSKAQLIFYLFSYNFLDINRYEQCKLFRPILLLKLLNYNSEWKSIDTVN